MTDILKKWLLFVFRQIGKHRNKTTQIKKPQKILVLQLNQLGDTLVFTPAMRALKKSLPNSRIDVLANEMTSQIYKYCPYVDGIWEVGNPLFALKTLAILRKLRRENYDLGILDAAQRAFRFNVISFLTGASERVGFDWDGRGIFNTINVPFEDKHFIDVNLDLMRALGAKADGDNMEIWSRKEDSDYVKRLLRENGILEDDLLICVNVSSKEPAKFWITERWAHLADLLTEKLDARIVFTGVPNDRRLVEPIINRMNYQGIDFVGKTSLHQFAALLRRSNLCITVDSGPMHAAAAVGTPLVALMSGTNYPYKWDPKTNNSIIIRKEVPCSGCRKSICPYPDHPCMSLIFVNDVMNAVEQVISSAG
jgi:lipopolysaccharide heptosyltransferase II